MSILDRYGYRLNVLTLFEKLNYVPSIIYYVNILSETDMVKQCIPFIEGLKNLSFSQFLGMKKVQINFYADNEEPTVHSPLNKENTIKLIKNTLKNMPNRENDLLYSFENKLVKYMFKMIIQFINYFKKILKNNKDI